MSHGPFLGTSEFASVVLGRLADSAHRPSLVVTLPDRRQGRGRRETPSPVATKAEELGIELLKSADVNADEDRQRILAADSGWATICAFGQLIKDPLLSERPMLNLHPSLLPRWRGAAPIERAILAGDGETGVAVMRLVAGLDSGPVALIEPTTIGADEDFGSLAERLAAIGGELLVSALDAAETDSLEWIDQDDAEATYAEKVTAEDRRLDPFERAAEIHNRIRALNPHIGTYLDLEDGGRLGVHAATVLNQPTWGPGSVVGENGELLLASADQTLRLDVVQPPGKKAMDGGSYLRGYGPPALAAPTGQN